MLFFLAVIATIPFAVGPDLNLLARIGPAILWIGALLASLLGLDRLFQADREDGSLDLLILSADRHMLALTVLVKCLAHWTASVLPLVIAAPLLGLFMNISPQAIAAATLTLLVGTPAITFIGAVGAAVAVALPRGGLMVSVLVLPLAIPVLIFGVSASYAAVAEPDPFLPPFLLVVRAVHGFRGGRPGGGGDRAQMGVGLSGETNLQTLLGSMRPSLAPGVFVFATVTGGIPDGIDPQMVFRESEGLTLIVARRGGAARRAHRDLSLPDGDARHPFIAGRCRLHGGNHHAACRQRHGRQSGLGLFP